MDRARLLERLMATFLGELVEHTRAINDDLLALEKNPSGTEREERFKTLFRAAHSLKGASRSVGVGLIEEASHRLEDILIAARDGQTVLDPPLFSLLFSAADAIEEAGMRLREQQDLSDSPLAAILPRLEDRASGLIATPVPIASEPQSKPVASASGVKVETAAKPVPARPAASAPRPAAPKSQPPIPLVPVIETPSPAPVVTQAAARSGLEKPQSNTAFVRVPAEKLDAMLARSGELLVARQRVDSRGEELEGLREIAGRWGDAWRVASKPLIAARNGGANLGIPRRAAEALTQASERLGELEKSLERLAVAMAADRRQLARAVGQLDEDVRRVRMLPFAEACQGLDRALRDVALSEGKQVELVIEGGDVELDRSVLEGLKDPLLHLVRNAVSHGVEDPNQRRAAGKSQTARVTVRAALRGEQVEVIVADDGAGLDYDALRRQAVQRGLAVPTGERDLADLIFLPGFSTAAMITNISGRGVGLDVVKSRVEALNGTIVLGSEPGRGTQFTLAVPLTLTTLRSLRLKAGGQNFVLASANIQKILRVKPDDLKTMEGHEVLVTGGPPLPVVWLTAVLGMTTPDTTWSGESLPGLIVAAGDRRAVFVIDEAVAEQEIIVKRMGTRLHRVRNVSGATILPDGTIALVLNATSLLRAAMGKASGHSPLRREAASKAPGRKRLLVVDDSVTTRTLEKSILEAAGYEVTIAVDGKAGWQSLQEQGADLIISDVEMPHMDGFELTSAVRNSARFANLPVVLFTSCATERDRTRGIEVGANAYIVKGEFDQNDLLETVAQLL